MLLRRFTCDNIHYHKQIADALKTPKATLMPNKRHNMRRKPSIFNAIDLMIASGAPPGSMLIADDIDNPKKFVIVDGKDMPSKPYIEPPAASMPKSEKTQSRIENDEYHSLKEVPPESDWIQERRNRSGQTARGYQYDVNEFKKFLGIKKPEDYRRVTRKHVTEWIEHLKKQKLTNESIGRKVSAVSSLFKYYCERAALKDNPCTNIMRPKVESNIGKTDEISRDEARLLLEAPLSLRGNTLRGLRDSAIVAVFLYHGLRRAEVKDLKVKSVHNKQGVPYLLVKGKGSKTRDLPFHPVALQKIYAYLEADKRMDELDSPVFCPLKKLYDSDGLLKHMSGNAIYDIVMYYAKMIGLKTENFHPHALRATWATNALRNGADLGKVQDYLGHASVQTTRIYDKRKDDLDDSPTFKVKY